MNTTSNAASGNGSLVYVVDDEPMLLELTTAILENLGLRVQTFRDAQAALEAFERIQPKPELIITDFSMERMNGMQLIEACRRLQPKQKVLLLTGTVTSEILDAAAERPDAYLGKPYHAGQLVEAVNAVLKGPG